MRRARHLLTATVAALATGASLTVAPVGAAAAGTVTDPAGAGSPAAEAPDAVEALEQAEALLTGTRTEAAAAEAEAGSATLALQELDLALDELEGRDRARAESLLARPTDRARDKFGDGYAAGTPVSKTCGGALCVHHVTTTEDRASTGFAAETRAELESVLAHHTGELGFRAPLPDNGRDGTPQFDVYLANIGDLGLYGYCSSERVGRGEKVRSGYCVLDNDYRDAPFGGGAPAELRKVTAAHEFLHAMQYAYDATEDGWLLEATATWAEEQYADEVDDNRQYLSGSQLRRPDAPIDDFVSGARSIYGNWIFFEHLANRFGTDVVSRIWERAGAATGDPDLASTPAVARTLTARGSSLREAYSLFAADNTVPGRSAFYPEGGEWGLKAPMRRWTTLERPRRQSPTWTQSLDHLTSYSVTFASRGFTTDNRLRIYVDGPAGATSPAAYVIVHRKDGSLVRRFVPLNGAAGRTTLATDFASARVARVSVTLVNASARFRCNQRTSYTCGGIPVDDGRRFLVRGTVVRT